MTRWIETGPALMGIAAGSARIYASFGGLNNGCPNGCPITEYDLLTGRQLQKVTFTNGHIHWDIALSREGRYIYTTNYYATYMTRLDTRREFERVDINVGGNPKHVWASMLAMDPMGRRLVIGVGRDGRDVDLDNDQISIIDISGGRFTLLGEVKMLDEPAGHNMAFDQNSRHVYVPTLARKSRGPSLYEISVTPPYKVKRRTILPSGRLEAVAVDDERKRVLISHREHRRIWAVDLQTFRAKALPVRLSGAPGLIEIDPARKNLWVLYPDIGSASIHDLKTLRRVGRVTNLRYPNDIAFSRDGKTVYIANGQKPGGIAVIELGPGVPPAAPVEATAGLPETLQGGGVFGAAQRDPRTAPAASEKKEDLRRIRPPWELEGGKEAASRGDRLSPADAAKAKSEAEDRRNFLLFVGGFLILAVSCVLYYVKFGQKDDKASAILSAAAPAPLSETSAGMSPGVGMSIGGKIELRSQVGAGGMGVVYEGYDTLLGRKVAIKRMHPELQANAKARARFLEEARIVSHLTHPYIVSIHDIIEKEKEIFLVLDFVDGKPLDQIMTDKGNFSFAETKRILNQVCQGIDAAHRAKVLHRDMKLSNIMLDHNGFAKVMDFGLAREAKDAVSRLTHAEVSGTPAYMAPEQHLGQAHRASDVFSIGVCLYEMLTGLLPYSGPDFLAQKERKKYTPPHFLDSSLPKDIDALVAAVLEPDPKKRLGDALDFFAKLDALQ